MISRHHSPREAWWLMLTYHDSSKAKSVELSGLPLCLAQLMGWISQTKLIYQVRSSLCNVQLFIAPALACALVKELYDHSSTGLPLHSY